MSLWAYLLQLTPLCYSFSIKPRNTYLSRTLIALLTYGGVPVEYFYDILKNTLEETQRLYSDEMTALKGNSSFRKNDNKTKFLCNCLWFIT